MFNQLFQKYGLQLFIISLALNVLFFVNLNQKKNTSNSNALSAKTATKVNTKIQDNLFNEVNPEKGYQINVSFGGLGPKMLLSGVIDYDKFKTIYEKSGTSLTKEQEEILIKGSENEIQITRENSYFLLNFFWAVGLANKSKILDEGDMVKYGQNQLGNFASTGGWSLAKTDAMNYYSKSNLIALNLEQEKLVEKVASNIYRPCCDNPTSFPDCNHGMALLGVLELMASNNATEQEMYEAAKYFNAFWFPGNYYDLAMYFKNKEGKNFGQIDGKTILDKEYSSASGYKRIKEYLAEKGLIQQPPKTGGGCGV